MRLVRIVCDRMGNCLLEVAEDILDSTFIAAPYASFINDAQASARREAATAVFPLSGSAVVPDYYSPASTQIPRSSCSTEIGFETQR